MKIRDSLNPKVDTPLFATIAIPLQLYHSPRAKTCVRIPYVRQLLNNALC